ncbi:MAG: FAD-dependent oxidoreductase [Hyphomonadaceae bacterium]|nr:FAD-dependent oxidoreductase [Hyphomonadaceae bacterium]
MSAPVIAIVGAGLAGLCLAREFSQRGASVRLIDQSAAGRGASWAAAGMLAPTYETSTEGPAHPGMFNLLFAARDYWQDWVCGNKAGPDAVKIGLQTEPLIALATTSGEAAAFARQIKFGRARALNDTETAALEPICARPINAAVAMPRDGQVDNRALVSWLIEDLSARSIEPKRQSVRDDELIPETLSVDIVVDTRGWAMPGMTPVKGTAIALAPDPGLPQRLVRWGRNYLVPKAGRIVLGAHAMPGLSDTSVDPGIVAELLAEASEMFPAVAKAQVLETWSGVRARLPDGAPVLGWRKPGQYVLGGLYRDGVLLSPLLAAWAAQEILGGDVPDLAQGFGPTRRSLIQA